MDRYNDIDIYNDTGTNTDIYWYNDTMTYRLHLLFILFIFIVLVHISIYSPTPDSYRDTDWGIYL